MKPPVEDCWPTTVLCIFLSILCHLVGWVSTSTDRLLLFRLPKQILQPRTLIITRGSPQCAKTFQLFSWTGNSGMGCYHGKFTFDQLSHQRGCLIKKLKMEGMNSMRYPPHTAKKLGWARFFILKTVDLGWMGRMALLAIMAVAAAVALQVSSK